MNRDDRDGGAYPVPAGRMNRMLRLGGMTSGILGGMVASGARQLAAGERPSLPKTLLTPATASRLTRDLGRLRGAAMKRERRLFDTAHIAAPAGPKPDAAHVSRQSEGRTQNEPRRP